MVVGTGMKLLELLALILTSASTWESAQTTPIVKIQRETILVSVTPVSKGIFAEISTNVAWIVAVIQMLHVLIVMVATFALVM